MKYFENKNKDISVVRFSFYGFIAFASVVFGVREIINYKERKALQTEVWAIAPESGQMVKMNKIPFTIEERKAEYAAHARDFLSHWYQFDQYTFNDHINYAANLIDKDTRLKEIAKYQEENTLAKISERDIILSIEIKKIEIDVTTRPYSGKFSILQTMRTSQNSNKRIIEGIFQLVDTEGRSYQNPHAALITNYQITRKENQSN